MNNFIKLLYIFVSMAFFADAADDDRAAGGAGRPEPVEAEVEFDVAVGLDGGVRYFPHATLPIDDIITIIDIFGEERAALLNKAAAGDTDADAQVHAFIADVPTFSKRNLSDFMTGKVGINDKYEASAILYTALSEGNATLVEYLVRTFENLQIAEEELAKDGTKIKVSNLLGGFVCDPERFPVSTLLILMKHKNFDPLLPFWGDGHHTATFFNLATDIKALSVLEALTNMGNYGPISSKIFKDYPASLGLYHNVYFMFLNRMPNDIIQNIIRFLEEALECKISPSEIMATAILVYLHKEEAERDKYKVIQMFSNTLRLPLFREIVLNIFRILFQDSSRASAFFANPDCVITEDAYEALSLYLLATDLFFNKSPHPILERIRKLSFFKETIVLMENNASIVIFKNLSELEDVKEGWKKYRHLNFSDEMRGIRNPYFRSATPNFISDRDPVFSNVIVAQKKLIGSETLSCNQAPLFEELAFFDRLAAAKWIPQILDFSLSIKRNRALLLSALPYKINVYRFIKEIPKEFSLFRNHMIDLFTEKLLLEFEAFLASSSAFKKGASNLIEEFVDREFSDFRNKAIKAYQRRFKEQYRSPATGGGAIAPAALRAAKGGGGAAAAAAKGTSYTIEDTESVAGTFRGTISGDTDSVGSYVDIKQRLAEFKGFEELEGLEEDRSIDGDYSGAAASGGGVGVAAARVDAERELPFTLPTSISKGAYDIYRRILGHDKTLTGTELESFLIAIDPARTRFSIRIEGGSQWTFSDALAIALKAEFTGANNHRQHGEYDKAHPFAIKDFKNVLNQAGISLDKIEKLSLR